MKPEEDPPVHKPRPGERPRFYDRLIWAVLWACRVGEIEVEEVQVRALKPKPGVRRWHLLAPEVKASSGQALALAKDLFDAEDDRIHHVDDKAKALLSATSILFTLTGAVVALTANRDDNTFRWLLGGALFLLLVTLFLLVGGYFGRSRFAQPVLTSETAAKLENSDQHELIRDYQTCAWLNSQSLEFLVAAYRAARRAFQCAMLVLGVAGLAALVTNRPNDSLIRQLRNDPQFIEKVRGPEGNPGPPGPIGPAGPRGESGPPGPTASISVPSPSPADSVRKRPAKRGR